MTALLAILSEFWPYIAAGAAALLFALQQRRAGADAERSKREREELKARDIRDEVQNDVGAMSAEQRRAELRKWSVR